MKKNLLAPVLLTLVSLLLCSCNRTKEPPVIETLNNIILVTDDSDIYIGDTTEITATADPIEESLLGLIWTSSDETIAKVENGVVSGLQEGQVTITAKLRDVSNTIDIKINSKATIYKAKKETSLLADTHFKNGWRLKSPETTTAHVEGYLDYNGSAEKDFYTESEDTAYWEMAQWWTPFNFIDAQYEYQNNVHHYHNESRDFYIDTNTGSLTMYQNAYAEYEELYQGPKPANKSWSHFLIEQNFPSELRRNMSTLENLWITFDVCVNSANYYGTGSPTGSNCAQLFFYLNLANFVPQDSNPEEVGRNGDNIWFGLPIYDTRFETISEYKAGDVGFEGATGSLIYSIANKNFLGSKPFQIGKTYHVEIDVAEYIKDAFVYGVLNGYLKNCKWENFVCRYMNYGFEIPGQYDISATIANLDIYTL